MTPLIGRPPVGGQVHIQRDADIRVALCGARAGSTSWELDNMCPDCWEAGARVSSKDQTSRCWFCRREVPVDTLIAGYDTFDDARLACNTCNDAMQWLNSHGLVVSRSVS